MIEIRHLQKAYENVIPLKDVNAVIQDGDVISIIGPSGTGKSTLLRCLNLLEKPTDGQIFLDGEEITAPGCNIPRVRQKIGMVFQSFNLFGHLTVIENVMLAPVDLLGKSRQEAYDTGMAILKRVGMSNRALYYPDQLSGGQKQRAAIARALAMDPEILLLDEPTSALDPAMKEEVQAVIHDLAQSGKTMLVVTHEMSLARAVSNRVFYMDQGGIYEDGTPDQIFEHPRKELTRRFIQGLKVLQLEIDSSDYDFIEAGLMIDTYCAQINILPRHKYRIRLLFEEMVQQILLPHLKDPRIRVVIEHSVQKEITEMELQYQGEPFNPADSENKLSYILSEKMVSDLQYSYTEGEEYPNTIKLSF